MPGKTDIFSLSWCNIVFEQRNKEYGAYVLRKINPKNTLIAVLSAVIFFVLCISAPLIISLIHFSEKDNGVKVVDVVTLATPPPIDPNEPPPPPVEPPPPLKSTVQFIPPKIVKDEDATTDTVIVQDLVDKDPGKTTQEGDTVNGVDPGLDNGVIDNADPEPVMIVEIMPEFPGGEGELLNFLHKQIHYPPIAKEEGIQGTVFIQFIISKDGQVSNVKVLRGPGAGLDEEAVRVVKLLPQWKPGRQGGRNVPVIYNLPVKFVLK